MDELYVTAEALKATGSLRGTTFVDDDIEIAIKAACRAIDAALGRRFYIDDEPTTRFYTSERPSIVEIDDLAEVTDDTEVAVAVYGGTDYQVWTEGTDFIFEPRNALADGRPYERIVIPRIRWRCLPVGSNVRVTGRFGWLQVPDMVEQYAAILARKLVMGSRNPDGVVIAGTELATVVRIARVDPYFSTLTENLDRSPVLA